MNTKKNNKERNNIMNYIDAAELPISVKELRQSGKYVQVWHKRRYYDPVNKRYVFLSKYERSIAPLPDYVKMLETGGETVVIIDNEWVGYSECSKKDNYCKKIGVKLALSRLMNVKN